MSYKREGIHNMSKTPTYCSWNGMKNRCYTNAKADGTHQKKGIKVCDRWHTFKNFLDDMGVRPDGMTIERIDNNGDYSPDNCRWATPKQQARNRNSNRNVSYNGLTLTMMEWAENVGLKFSTLQTRLNRGWSIEKALTTPARGYTL